MTYPRGIPGLVAFPRSREFGRFGRRVRLSRLRFAAALPICAAAPHHIRSFDLIDLLWGHDPGGGPEDAPSALRALLWWARSELFDLGVVVAGRPGRGSPGYRAVDLSPPAGADPPILSRFGGASAGTSPSCPGGLLFDQSPDDPPRQRSNADETALAFDVSLLPAAALHARKHGEAGCDSRWPVSNTRWESAA